MWGLGLFGVSFKFRRSLLFLSASWRLLQGSVPTNASLPAEMLGSIDEEDLCGFMLRFGFFDSSKS